VLASRDALWMRFAGVRALWSAGSDPQGAGYCRAWLASSQALSPTASRYGRMRPNTGRS